ncbi:MAG: calcium-binding protein [Pseudomonadota bacterium]
MVRSTLSKLQPLPSFEELGLVGINDLQVIEGPNKTLLFSATRGDGWLTAFDLGNTAEDTSLLQQWRISSDFLQLETTDLVLHQLGAETQLYMAGLKGVPLTGVNLDLNATAPIGAMVQSTASGIDLGRITEMEMFSNSTGVAALRQGGLVNLAWNSPNVLNSSHVDQGTLLPGARATDIVTAEHNGINYAFVSYSSADAVSMFRQNPNDVLEHVIDVSAADGFWVDAPSDLAVTTAPDGRLYAIVAGSGSDSLTTFAVSPAGNGMLPVDHVIDTRDTRFEGANHINSLHVGNHNFILAAGADDGISMFTLLPGGRLHHIESFTGTADVPLHGISAIEASGSPEAIRLWVATQSAPYLAEFTIALTDLGINQTAGFSGGTLLGSARDDILSGAAGNDIIEAGAGDDILLDGGAEDTLVGGPGADIFIFSPDAARDRVLDFRQGTDQIDLSSYGALAGLGELQIIPRHWGAELRIGEELLEVLSFNGRPLSANELSGDTLITSSRTATDPALYPGSNEEPRPDLNRGYMGNPDATNPAELTPPWRDAPKVTSFVQPGDRRGTDAADYMQAASQNDRLFGGRGDDTILLGNGADFADGQVGNDSVEGGNGADTLMGGIGFDTLHGASGNDTLSGDSFADLLFGGDGADILLGGDGFDVLHGEDGDDQIWAGSSPDRIFGGKGDDWLSAGSNFGTTVDGVFGEAGDDTLFGNAGFDMLNGGDGNDVLDGGHQADNLYGEAGDDILLGNLGFDRLFGGDGQDRLYGGPSGDGLFGQSGDDTIWGGEGDDRLFGGQGRDILDGGEGADRMHGDAGFDTIIGGAGDDLIYGGFNADEFVFATDHGHDTLADFEAQNDNEFINFIGVSGLDAFQDVLNGSVQTGSDVIITTGTASSIRLLNVKLSDLDETDFAF